MTEVTSQLVESLLANPPDGFHLPAPRGVDFFARTGEWITTSFEPLAKKWICCEISETHREALRTSMPSAELIFNDSFNEVKKMNNLDVVLADCPQGLFGENGSYAEHFEFLPLLMEKLSNQAVLFFNVNTEPYHDKTHSASRPDDYGMRDFEEWSSRRMKFYDLSSHKPLSKDFVREFYEVFFRDFGFRTSWFLGLHEPPNLGGHNPHIYRVLTALERV